MINLIINLIIKNSLTLKLCYIIHMGKFVCRRFTGNQTEIVHIDQQPCHRHVHVRNLVRFESITKIAIN